MSFRLFISFLVLCHPLNALIYVDQPASTLYEHPDRRSSPVSEAIYGTVVQTLSTDGDWSLIETPDGYLGWIESSRLIRRDTPYPGPGHRVRVNVLYSHLYEQPSVTQRAPAITLAFGTEAELISRDEGQRWLQVRLLSGEELYLQRGDIEIDPKLLSLEEMIATCHKFLGLPYTWGGTTSFGFDCSGFVQSMYRLMGVSLPRDACQQVACGTPVEKEAIQPGDLLFFGLDQTIHVAIYLGDHKIIQAAANVRSGPPAVRIDELCEEEAVLPFLCARNLSNSY